MADWPIYRASRYKDYGTVLTTSLGTVVTGGAANTKGSYAQLTASTDYAGMPLINITSLSVNSYDMLVDIAVGAAGSENIIISNILYSNYEYTATSIFFPIVIPAGSRISARTQDTIGSGVSNINVGIIGLDFVNQAFQRVTTYGANTADSGGTPVTVTALNIKGAYSQLTASCNPINYMVLCIGNAGNYVLGDAGWLLDIAIGAAGSEQVVVSNIAVRVCNYTDLYLPNTIHVPVNIPAGNRIAVRGQSSQTSDPTLDVIICGVS